MVLNTVNTVFNTTVNVIVMNYMSISIFSWSMNDPVGLFTNNLFAITVIVICNNHGLLLVV